MTARHSPSIDDLGSRAAEGHGICKNQQEILQHMVRNAFLLWQYCWSVGQTKLQLRTGGKPSFLKALYWRAVSGGDKQCDRQTAHVQHRFEIEIS